MSSSGNLKDSALDRNNLRKWAPVLLGVYMLGLLSIFPFFFVNLADVGSYDEAVYINSGRALLEGQLADYAWGPMQSFFYAIIQLPLLDSPQWMAQSASAGRFIIYNLLFLVSCLIALELRFLAPPLVSIILPMTAPLAGQILTNTSDGLFTSLSGLGFWQLLVFYRTRKMQHLFWSATFVSASCLSRNDGLILFATLNLLAVIIAGRRMAFKVFAVCLIPFLFFVVGYHVLISGQTGSLEFSTGKRLYVAFEQAQGVAYEGRFRNRNPFAEGTVEARKLFGTPDQNKDSVVNAIKRNPVAFLERVIVVILNTLPRSYAMAYGAGFSTILLLLMARGVVDLWKKKEWIYLLCLTLWPAFMGSYLITSYQARYFFSIFFLIYPLAAVGFGVLINNFKDSAQERSFWFVSLSSLAMLSFINNQGLAASWFFAMAVALYIVYKCSALLPHWQPLAGHLICLCTFLFLRSLLGGPAMLVDNYHHYETAQERATLFLQAHFEPGARIGGVTASILLNSRMTYVPMFVVVRSVKNRGDLLRWIKRKKVQAIYVDGQFRRSEPDLLKIIQKEAGKHLTVVFRKWNVVILEVEDLSDVKLDGKETLEDPLEEAPGL